MSDLRQSPSWRRLAAEAGNARTRRIVDLLRDDPSRVDRLTHAVGGVTVDASKTHLTPDAERALTELAGEADVVGSRERMFAGEAINHTEGRAALHAALRTPELRSARVDGEPVGPVVETTRRRMAGLVDGIRSGEIRAADGAPFTAVVNIGIGGSDLGPRLVCDALDGDAGPLAVHFVANIDPVALDRVLARIDPARTLFIVASKTFTTLETLANARRVRERLVAAVGREGVCSHLVGVTGARERAEAFGIDPERVLDLPVWVGGRYSVWSAVGLPVALACGNEAFDGLLAGAATMDRHFRDTAGFENLPLRLALAGIWHGNFLDIRNHIVVPYGERLALLPDYLQQLELESNGKAVDRDGDAIDYPTAPALWGTVGTTSQHAFFQWLHQGTEAVSCDLIAVRGRGGPGEDELAANCLAQGAALLAGTGASGPAATDAGAGREPHRRLPGNRPSTTLLLDDLTPATLGSLLALYEHKVFCQAMIWRINPFDQWGVERGKQLAGALVPLLASGADDDTLDASTRALVRRYRGIGS